MIVVCELTHQWASACHSVPFAALTATMAEREERRFAQVSRESVALMAESAGVELGEEMAAVLAEDVCYRLREAAQVSAA